MLCLWHYQAGGEAAQGGLITGGRSVLTETNEQGPSDVPFQQVLNNPRRDENLTKCVTSRRARNVSRFHLLL